MTVCFNNNNNKGVIMEDAMYYIIDADISELSNDLYYTMDEIDYYNENTEE